MACGTTSNGSAANILEFLPRLEANGPARRDADFLASPGVAADATLPGLHLEHAKAPQLNAFTAHHGGPHGVEDRIDGHFGLHLRDVGELGNLGNDVDFDHV